MGGFEGYENLCYDENICNVELSGFQTASRFEIRLNDLLNDLLDEAAAAAGKQGGFTLLVIKVL